MNDSFSVNRPDRWAQPRRRPTLAQDWRAACGAFLLTLFLLPAATAAQVRTKPKPASPPSATPSVSDQEAIHAIEEAAKPGTIHAQMMKLAGQYSTTIKFYSQPGTEPQESRGTATVKGILGGRFIEEKNSGESLGQRFDGLRLYGYNNGSKHYESVWIYNGSTAILVLDGSSDDGGKTVRYTGAFLGPGGTKQIVHVVLKRPDPDHFIVRLTGDSSGGFAPSVETIYTRKKGSIPAR